MSAKSQSFCCADLNAEEIGDPYPAGIEANRKGLEMVVQIANDQQIVRTRFSF